MQAVAHGRPDVLLCDADGCLFPSEEPAFAASAEVTNGVLERAGASARYEAEHLLRTTTGKTFRTTITDLLAAEGITPGPGDLERWVEEEREAVTVALAEVLEPDDEVIAPLEALEAHMRLAVVSSSAIGRLRASFQATGLDRLFSPEVFFSAESSLPEPRSKPDPGIYLHAVEATGAEAPLAVEDSVPGVTAAVAAGVPVVGNLQFVPEPERDDRAAALREAGATGSVASWRDLAMRLDVETPVGTSVSSR